MTDIIGPADAPNFTTSRPADDRSIGSTDTWMKDCTGPTANDGTKVKAAWLNAVIGQFRSLIRGNGNTGGGPAVVTEDNVDDMALRAIQHLIQRGQTLYGVDSGSANALVVSLTPALAEYKAGLTLRIKAANSNTGATTLNVNGLGAKSVVRRDGTMLKDSDVLSGAAQEYIYDGTNFQLMSASGRAVLARNTDLYVNGAIGNDANDGTANTSGKALATIQKAIDIAFGYPPSQYTITVHVADGTYAPFRTPIYNGPNIIVDGNATTPANVIVYNPSGFVHCALVEGPNTLTCKNFTVQNAGASGSAGFIAVSSGSNLYTYNTRSNDVVGAVFEAYGGANVRILGNHTFIGNAGFWFWGMLGGFLSLGTGITFTVGPGISTNTTAVATMGGKVACEPPNAVYTGSALVSGGRYSANMGGLINTNGGGANVFPGTVAGSTATGGQYA